MRSFVANKSPLLSFLLLGTTSIFLSDALITPHPRTQHSPVKLPLSLDANHEHSISRSESMRQLFLPAAAALLFIPTSSASAMYENAPVRIPDVESGDGTTAASSSPGPTSLPSGVSYEDLRPGTGDIVSEGKRVNIQWVLKRSNGYYVDSSERNDGVPFIFTVGDPRGAIAGLDEGIRGMRVNGIRRIIIPPNLSYVDGVEDDKPGPVPMGFGPKQRMRRVMTLLKDIPGESVLLDVKATRVQ